jgi:uncharacterized protein
MLDLSYSREQLEELCRRYHVSKLSVFGSTLRGEARPDSDLDLLVEFEPKDYPGWEYFDLEEDLGRLFKKKVDLVTEDFLRDSLRQKIIDSARLIYDRQGSRVH